MERPARRRIALGPALLALIAVGAGPRLALAMPEADFDALMEALSAGDFAVVEAFLEPRSATSQQDPEFYVILLNYAARKADRGGMVVAQGEPREGDYALKDPETGEVVGFMGHREAWDEPLVVDAIHRTQAALPGFRSRLDIHFGIVAVAERIGRLDLAADQLVAMLEISREIDNRWTWGRVGSMDGDPQEFMIQGVLPRTSAMFRAETADGDRALVRVSNALVEHYPQLVYGHANLGVLAMVKGRYAEARLHLERALALDPLDEVVRGNLEQLAAFENAQTAPAKAD